MRGAESCLADAEGTYAAAPRVARGGGQCRGMWQRLQAEDSESRRAPVIACHPSGWSTGGPGQMGTAGCM